VSFQRPGEIFNERGKESLPRLVGRSLEDAPQSSPFIESAQGKRDIVAISHRNSYALPPLPESKKAISP
jgi:hypothetical protein